MQIKVIIHEIHYQLHEIFVNHFYCAFLANKIVSGKILAVFISDITVPKFIRHKLITILNHISHHLCATFYTAFLVPPFFRTFSDIPPWFLLFSPACLSLVSDVWMDLRAFSAFFRTSFIILPSCVICVLSPRVSFLFIPTKHARDG